ncbi:unnamed protein product [Cochlearia groenlandica]
MSNVTMWSNLPQEIIDEISNRVFSKVELLRMRSICKFLRYAVVVTKRFPKRENRNRIRLLPDKDEKNCLLSPAVFFRVILSMEPDKGWLIKAQDTDVTDEENCKRLFYPLSRFSMKFSDQTLNLLDFTVSEIHQTFDAENSYRISHNFARVILVENLVFAVDKKKKIWWCNTSEGNNNNNYAHYWTRILDREVQYFSDIIVHVGQIYALDLKGAVWWVSLSDELNIFQFTSSTPMDYYNDDETCICKDKRLVEYLGEICVVLRFSKSFRVNRTTNIERTVGFKVFKMNMEIFEWVEVKSLEDKTFVMATDSCFEISARDYYGCLENSIYFIDEKEANNVQVFKFSDNSITKMVKSSYQSCFQMFLPPFA